MTPAASTVSSAKLTKNKSEEIKLLIMSLLLFKLAVVRDKHNPTSLSASNTYKHEIWQHLVHSTKEVKNFFCIIVCVSVFDMLFNFLV